MADEQTKPPFDAEPFIPEGLDWPSLLARDGDELEVHYRHVLTELGRRTGMLGVVFRKAQNRIQDPAKLRRLIVDLIDRETWLTLDADVKGDAYEGLLEKNAEDVKSGAGQYFTPRPLIRALVEVMRPEPGMTICDPACGTGGFLLAAHEWISKNYPYLDPDEKRALRFDALHGWEIVDNTARLCVMNLLLHGIGSEETDSPIRVDDALKADPGDRFELVLTNPPFGKKSSMTVVNAEGESEREQLVIVRDDFWASTSNKQLNFVQHVKTLLAINGRAAVVVPDNVIFEGGAGETVRRKLLQECDVHTLLRLPTGVLLRRVDPARQGQPRPDLVTRRLARGHGPPAPSGRDRAGDRRGPRGGSERVRRDRGEPADTIVMSERHVFVTAQRVCSVRVCGRHVEAEHHPALVMLGDVAVRHPDAGVRHV